MNKKQRMRKWHELRGRAKLLETLILEKEKVVGPKLKYAERNRNSDKEYARNWAAREDGVIEYVRNDIARLKIQARAMHIARAYLRGVPLSDIDMYWYGITERQMNQTFFSKDFEGQGPSYNGFYRDRQYRQFRAIEEAMFFLGLARLSPACERRYGFFFEKLDVLDTDYEDFVAWVAHTRPPEIFQGEIKTSEKYGAGETFIDRWFRFWEEQKGEFVYNSKGEGHRVWPDTGGVIRF